MHQKLFGGQAPPEPAGELTALHRTLSAKGKVKGREGGNDKGDKAGW